jgi:hypothetical protein
MNVWSFFRVLPDLLRSCPDENVSNSLSLHRPTTSGRNTRSALMLNAILSKQAQVIVNVRCFAHTGASAGKLATT